MYTDLHNEAPRVSCCLSRSSVNQQGICSDCKALGHSECCPLMAQLSTRSGTGHKVTAPGFEAGMVVISLTRSFIVAIVAGVCPDKKKLKSPDVQQFHSSRSHHV